MPDSLPPEDEIARLRAENEELRIERDKARKEIGALQEGIRIAAEWERRRRDSERERDEWLFNNPTIRGASIIPPTLHTHPNPKREDR